MDTCFVTTQVPRLYIRIGPRITVARIQQVVSEFYEINPIHMTSPLQERRVTRPRQLAMYLARELTQMSSPEVGRRFGNRDHTTVLHAVKEVRKRLETDDEFAHEVNLIRRGLEA